MAVASYVRHPLHYSVLQAVPQRGKVLNRAFAVRHGELARLAQSYDPCHVLRSCAEAAFLVSSRYEGRQFNTLPYVDGTDPFGSIYLVRRQRQEVHLQLLEVYPRLADALNGVRVEHDSVLLRYKADLRDGLDGADFVVPMHHCDEDGVLTYSGPHVLYVHQPAVVHWEVRHLVALLFQELAGLENGGMLYLRGYYVSALVLPG